MLETRSIGANGLQGASIVPRDGIPVIRVLLTSEVTGAGESIAEGTRGEVSPDGKGLALIR